MAIELPGVTMKNPLMPASGTFGFGRGYAKQYDLNQLGALVTKSTTLAPRLGNAGNVYAEGPSSTLNAVGLKNPGLTAVMHTELPWLAANYPELPVIASIAGDKIEEYVTVAKTISQAPNVRALELNISCPNVEQGGLAFGVDPEIARQVTAAVVTVSAVPVYVKLSPNVTDITEIAQAVIDGGAAALSLINTLIGMRFDLSTGQPVIDHTTGGISGPALLPLALRMVYQVRQMTNLPIIGMGGISSGHDVAEMLTAGADAVAIGSANYYQTQAIPKILAEYNSLLEVH